ncbi:hypothetical protein DOM22_01595 [Bdellovibrio sp. ZAP7]|uniref:hypothetical protein n=1 Tax=Bdellovibrio sp. ZAP7 TaxID=2231053 RepID=UPI00115B9E9D|nr:hypothetical protein [Bdellovibrio sp. ZAP7]QDK43946.1 hypothetical protein DOM22_01595 [Bdellovibrio sp. ZAP7]
MLQRSMKFVMVCTISLLSGMSLAATKIYTPQDKEYFTHSSKLDRALQLNSGQLQVTNEKIPTTAVAVWKLFGKACVPNVRNDRYAKTMTVQKNGNLTVLNFQCDNKSDYHAIPETIQFIATLDQHEILADLQVLQFTTDISKPANIKTDDPSDILLEVGAGTLMQGLLAKDQDSIEHNDKIINSVAGSLVAVSSAALAYKGFNITKKQAYWIGVASSVVASMLKSAYDTYTANEVNATDTISHRAGFIPNNIDISFKISF